MRCASVSSRLTGSPADDRGDRLGGLAVVHGVGDVVGRGGAARARRRASTSTTKSWPSRRSSLVHAVAAEDAQARQRDLVDEVHRSSPSHIAATRSASPGRGDVVHAHRPRSRLCGQHARDRGREVAARLGHRRVRRGSVGARAPRRGTACGSCRRARGGRGRRRAAAPRRTSQFCAPFLPKPMPGSTMTPAGRDAGRRGGIDALGELARATSCTTSAYSARAYMSADGPRQCPRTSSASVPATAASRSGVGQTAGDVVDDARARLHGGERGRRVHRVDADDGARLGQRSDDGQHALLLHARRDALRARARRLAADVEQMSRPPRAAAGRGRWRRRGRRTARRR